MNLVARSFLTGLMRKNSYSSKILSAGPVAYWPLWEPSGTVTQCSSDSAMNGVYARDVSVMTTGTGIGDGNTAPNFDGVQDVANIYSALFASTFNGREGTLSMWARVSGAGVWADATNRWPVSLGVDFGNRLAIYKDAAANRMTFSYIANGTTSIYLLNGHSPTVWTHYAMSWSVSADEVRAYLSGVQTGATMTSIDLFVGTFSNTLTCIGANTTGPVNLYDGRVAHVAVFDRALSPNFISTLAQV